MSDDHTWKERFSDKHPANYDQQLELARELLLKSNGWILLLNEPQEDDMNQLHGMMGLAPGIDLPGFMDEALKSLATMVNDLRHELSGEEEDDDEGETGI